MFTVEHIDRPAVTREWGRMIDGRMIDGRMINGRMINNWAGVPGARCGGSVGGGG